MLKKIFILFIGLLSLSLSATANDENLKLTYTDEYEKSAIPLLPLSKDSVIKQHSVSSYSFETAAWYSSDQSDFSPLVNSTWDFPVYTDNSDLYFQLVFGSTFFTDSVGDLYLQCTMSETTGGISGIVGKAYFTDNDGAVYSSASTLFSLYIYFPDQNLNFRFEFTVSGNTASGWSFLYSFESEEYTSAYYFTGTKIVSDYSYEYYLPYFTSGGDNWTGVALRNLRMLSNCNVEIVIYNSAGTILRTDFVYLNPSGQFSQVVGTGLTQNGWIQVNSTEELAGLCFSGKKGSASYMADIPLSDTISTVLIVPHVAQNAQWDTSILVCNPNSIGNTVYVTLYNPDGTIQNSTSVYISANGSTNISLSMLTGATPFNQGSVRITASYGVVAFALYNDIKNGGYSYAGICAIAEN